MRMAVRLYTLYKPVSHRTTPWRVIGWMIVLGMVFAWWITLAPGPSNAANSSRGETPSSPGAP